MRGLFLTSISVLALGLASPSLAQTAVRTMPLGQTISGMIGPEDPKLSSDNSSYEVYRVLVPAGRVVTATLTSSAFQPVLGAGDRITDSCETCTINIGETDKPAVTTRSSSDAGAMEFRVNTMNAGETGAFTLRVEASVPAPLTARPLAYGASVNGALTAADARTADDNAVDAYSVRLAANQTVQIDLSSTEFDAKLVLKAPNGGQVAEDDDGGPSTSARIVYTAPRAGLYQIQAMALNSESLGAYTLRAGPRVQLAAMGPPRALVLGQSVSGAITPNTPRYEAEGEEIVAMRYSFNAQEGKVYRITADVAPGSQLDPKVSIGKLTSNGDFEAINSDDDGGGERNAALRFRAEASGLMVVEVSPVGETTGAYTLNVRQSPPDRAPGNPIALSLGQTTSGQLVDGGPRRQISNDALYNIYSVALTAGQRVTIRMDKDEDSNLDPFLEIGNGSAENFNQLAEDDDGGKDLNARLRFVAPQAGTYLIRASAVAAQSEGRYSLSVETTPPLVMPPAPVAIGAGQTRNGVLSAEDPQRNDTTYYDRYVFNAQAGEIYEITMDSEDFDALVGVRHSDRVDDEYATDDDSGGGTNAKLTYRVAVSGQQVIRATSVGEESTGRYTLKIEKK